ncbi:beta-defensin 113 [Molossus nigricans]
MKILCVLLTFVFTASCGPSVSQRQTRGKTREVILRKAECYLVRGACKTSCNTWEYIYNYCNNEPCCVVREYIKPITNHSTFAANTNVIPNSTTLHNTTL